MKKIVISIIIALFPIFIGFILFIGYPNPGNAKDYTADYIKRIYNVKEADITIKRAYGSFTATCKTDTLTFNLYRKLTLNPWGLETDCNIKEQLDKECNVEINIEGKSAKDIRMVSSQKLKELIDLYEIYNIWSFNPKVEVTLIKGEEKTKLTYTKYMDPDEWETELEKVINE